MTGVSLGPVRTRFAPSPTGFLHVGAFRTALFSWLLARKHGGQFVLRIEDTDQTRLVPGSLEHILRSLAALGLDIDEGPDRASVARLDAGKYGAVDPALLPDDGGACGPYFQSQRLPRYHEVIEQLIATGRAYYAFETREELDRKRLASQAAHVPYLYDRKFRDYPLADARARVADGEPHVVRLKMPTAGTIVTHDVLHGEIHWDASTQDDFIVLKADGFPPYHLAAMVDDHDMQITHVLRGDDWLPSFPKHIQIFEALGWEPPQFVHAANVLGPDGKKLSKRHGALPLVGPVPELKDGKPTGEDLRGFVNQEGYLPDALVNFLALLGWSPGDEREVMARAEIVAAFSLDRVSKAGGVFDIGKLTWMNGVYIRALSPEQLVEHTLPFLPESARSDRAYAAAVIALEQERMKTLADVPALTDFFFTELPDYQPKSVDKWLKAPGTADYLSDVAAALADLSDWSPAAIEATSRQIGERHGRSKGDITHPLRVAATGREVGPSLFDALAVLGGERVRTRFARAVELARS
jgi:glutamyl-tRNA synthetase